MLFELRVVDDAPVIAMLRPKYPVPRFPPSIEVKMLFVKVAPRVRIPVVFHELVAIPHPILPIAIPTLIIADCALMTLLDTMTPE